MLSSKTSVSNPKQLNIAIISTIVFLYVLKLPNSSKFPICPHSLDIQASSTHFMETSYLYNVPSKYHKFANIFSKVKAEVSTSHCFYNLKINLEESAQPPVAIYSLSVSKQETLREFIEKNLNTEFI